MYKLNIKHPINSDGGVTMLSGCSSDIVTTGNLIARIRLGDTSAYDELVRRHRARAVRIAQSFIRDRDLAEDTAQEAFVRTFLSLDKLKAPDAFVTYLTRTIVRLAIDHSRKMSSSEISTDVDPPPAEPGVPAEEAIYVRSILDKLSMKLRAVIVLRDVDGMTYDSIARVLRLPVGTVKSRLAAARAEFKSLYLEGMGTGEGGLK